MLSVLRWTHPVSCTGRSRSPRTWAWWAASPSPAARQRRAGSRSPPSPPSTSGGRRPWPAWAPCQRRFTGLDGGDGAWRRRWFITLYLIHIEWMIEFYNIESNIYSIQKLYPSNKHFRIGIFITFCVFCVSPMILCFCTSLWFTGFFFLRCFVKL